MRSRSAALLPLHYGRAPRWLFDRMVRLAECIVKIIIHEYGVHGLFNRLSDPWFFQSLSCVLGYDWHSSGTTTVTCGALKEAIDPQELNLVVAGGKGRASKKTPEEIETFGLKLGLSSRRLEELIYASRLTAKVDNSLVQDGYNLYHHIFIFDKLGDWIVIQQGLNKEKRNARRYHWPLKHRSLINEPQNAILCDSRISSVLNMTSAKSLNNRKASLDLAKENPRKIKRILAKPSNKQQQRLENWMGEASKKILVMPATINWKALRNAYEFQPSSYEELISLRGVGPSTIRGLALVSELIYSERPDWSDPVRFSFAFGGKDGVPFPVNKRAMDEAIDILRMGIKSTSIRREEKIRALKRLRKCVPPISESRRERELEEVLKVSHKNYKN